MKPKNVYIKYNTAVNKVIVIREDGNGKELLTKEGEWVPWSQKAELFDSRVQIDNVFRYHPSGNPPD